MGLREEIQSEVAAAFDEDLADAVSDFSGSYVTHRHWDPVTETGGESTAIYTGRGVLTRYKLGRIDGINILHGDLKLTALVCEVTDKPAVDHIIEIYDPVSRQLQRYEAWDIEPSIFAGMIEEDVGLKIRYIAMQILTAIDIAAPVDTGRFRNNNLVSLQHPDFGISDNVDPNGLQMKFTEIRNTVISRMTAQTIIDGKDVLYPNGPTFDPSGAKVISAFIRETVAGTTPASGDWSLLKRTSWGVKPTQNKGENNEIGGSRMAQGATPGTVDVGGDVGTKFRWGQHDDFLASCFGAEWSGDSLTMGNERITFSLATYASDVGIASVVRGAQVGSWKMQIPNDGDITATVTFAGLDWESKADDTNFIKGEPVDSAGKLRYSFKEVSAVSLNGVAG
ncbi:hypothetical protein TTRE_0000944601, partial [Trichuris trichiura]